jgi:hypothetical protein
MAAKSGRPATALLVTRSSSVRSSIRRRNRKASRYSLASGSLDKVGCEQDQTFAMCFLISGGRLTHRALNH